MCFVWCLAVKICCFNIMLHVYLLLYSFVCFEIVVWMVTWLVETDDNARGMLDMHVICN